MANFCSWRYRLRLHVTNLPCLEREECSLIIPNGSTQGPPTSRAVQVNLGNSFAVTEGFPANRVRTATASGYIAPCFAPAVLLVNGRAMGRTWDSLTHRGPLRGRG
jgi:hypothetical protein